MESGRIKYNACPLCQSADIRPLITVDCTQTVWPESLGRFMSWMTCADCEHIFTDGYFNAEALNIMFEFLASLTSGQLIVGADIEFHRKLSAKMVERVVDAIGLPKNRLWLDVGFGNGALLMTAKEFGFEVFGVDLNKRGVEEVSQFGIPTYYGTIQDVMTNDTLKAKPSVISMADVVEHEPFPLEVLRCARELIDSPGILLISMPNASAPLWHHWNATNQNPYWVQMDHYHNFTRERLYAVLQSTGFRPVHYNISERYRCCMEVLAEPV